VASRALPADFVMSGGCVTSTLVYTGATTCADSGVWGERGLKVDVATTEECQQNCLDDDQCNFFLHRPGRICRLYSTCSETRQATTWHYTTSNTYSLEEVPRPAYDVRLPGGVAAYSVDLGLGTCTNAGIIAACAAQGLKPLCDNPYYHTSGGGECLHPAQDTYRDQVTGGVYYSSPDRYSGRSYTLCHQRIPMGFPPGDGSFHGVCMYAQGNGATKPLKQHHSTHSFGDSGHNDKSFHTYCQSEMGPGSYNEGCFLGEPTPCDAYPYLGNKFSRQSPPYSAETANPAYIGTRPNPTGYDMAACKPESEGGMGCWKTLCVEEGSDGGPVSLPADAGTPGKPASGSGCE